LKKKKVIFQNKEYDIEYFLKVVLQNRKKRKKKKRIANQNLEKILKYHMWMLLNLKSWTLVNLTLNLAKLKTK
jgi:hypothetical protein